MYITVYVVSALKQKDCNGVTWIVANIPIVNKDKVESMFGNSNIYHIQYHTNKI